MSVKTNVLKNIFIFFYLASFIFLIVNRIYLVFDYSFDLAGIEQIFIYYIIRIANNLDLYTQWDKPPFANNQYGFVYFELISNLFSIGKNEVLAEVQIYQFTRIINIFLNLLCSILGVKLYNSLFIKSKFSSLIVFIAIFLSYNTIYFAARPDSLKTVLVLLSLFCYVKLTKENTQSLIYQFGFVLTSCLAFFTKQDALIPLSLFCLSGILFFNRFIWIRTSLILVLCLGATLFAAQTYYGHAFLTNFTMGTQFSLSFKYFFASIFTKFWHWFLFCIASIFLAWKSKNYYIRRLIFTITLWLLCTLMISFKWGAGPNYFQDIIIILIVLFAGSIPNINAKPYWHIIYFLPIFLFSADLYQGNIKVADPSAKQHYQELFFDSIQAAVKVEQIANNTAFNLLTYEKQICNFFPKDCLFPSYESDMPQLLGHSIFYHAPSVEASFPTLPKISNMKPVESLVESYSKSRMILVLAKNSNAKAIFEIPMSENILVDSTTYFYIYLGN